MQIATCIFPGLAGNMAPHETQIHTIGIGVCQSALVNGLRTQRRDAFSTCCNKRAGQPGGTQRPGESGGHERACVDQRAQSAVS